MNRSALTVMCLAVLLAASQVGAISPSDDLLIAGAARTNRWIADLYINNPGDASVSVNVMWLERGQANPNPAFRNFNVGAGETLILDDVLHNNFGFNRAEGAFRIVAMGGVVTANLIVFTGAGDPDGTYGSGFEAIPASAATAAGESTNLTGVVLTDDFYTNLFALAGANGATVDIDLLDPSGALLDTENVVLQPYEPWLSSVQNLWDLASFENGTALVRVGAGSMVILGSKVDRRSLDPTTLEQEFGAGAGSVDGTYQFAIYDSLGYASGGNLVIENGIVEAIYGTYTNYDKLDNEDNFACPVIFPWGFEMPPTPVEDFVSGISFTDTWDDNSQMTWTVTFTLNDGLGFSGTVEVVGSNFSGDDAGCNGEFPAQTFEGGKSN
ncbi:MAG: hypothetical protein LJE93_12520 [Acidobacteria bacterium]|nr:hypothetical protein [Acidobacteriota bacterium]